MLLSTNFRVFNEISSTSTLGLLRNPTNDQLQVKNITSQVQQPNCTASTKRKVLATTASISDTLGILSPAVIAYKIFLQKLWQDKLQWDFLKAVNGLMEPAFTCAPQTVTTRHIVKFCVPHRRWHH